MKVVYVVYKVATEGSLIGDLDGLYVFANHYDAKQFVKSHSNEGLYRIWQRNVEGEWE